MLLAGIIVFDKQHHRGVLNYLDSSGFSQTFISFYNLNHYFTIGSSITVRPSSEPSRMKIFLKNVEDNFLKSLGELTKSEALQIGN